MKISKKVTAAKVAANRKSSEKSPGPKTVRGKGFARMNAVKHGITAGLLLPGESSLEFEQFRRGLITDFVPVGDKEYEQAEIYYVNSWRLKRVYPAEAGEITKLLCEYNPAAELAASEHARPYLQGLADLKKLDEIESQISQHGRVSPENLAWLRELPYGAMANDFVGLIVLAQDNENTEDGGPKPDVPAAADCREPTSAASTPEDCGFVREVLLNALAYLKNKIREEAAYHGQYTFSKVEATKAALRVPQEAVLNRLMRYENHLQNKMNNALHNLERMQRLRRGNEVPPPTARVR